MYAKWSEGGLDLGGSGCSCDASCDSCVGDLVSISIPSQASTVLEATVEAAATSVAGPPEVGAEVG